MKTAFRIAALFAVYSGIGAGGELVAGLVSPAAERSDGVLHQTDASAPSPRVVVDVKPSITTRVQVRHGGACTYEVDRELTVPLQGGETLAISAGSGALHVEGRSDLREIVVVGSVCASHEEYVDDLRVTAERASAGNVTITTHYPDQRNRSRGQNTARIDLTVLVPAGMTVDIEDSSGDMVVSGTGDLRVDDSSGAIRVSDVRGALHIDDSSGEIEIRNVAGDVTIADGSGGLDISGVDGSISLRDGSGSIDVSDVTRDVVVESDGSGGIDVRGVGGDFRVDRDGSGGIRHQGVEGRVDVPQPRGRRRG